MQIYKLTVQVIRRADWGTASKDIVDKTLVALVIVLSSDSTPTILLDFCQQS
jgi:hypothetical protein